MNLMASKNFIPVSIISLALLVSACSVWENFTTYFNSFYNVQKLYDNAQEQINNQQRDLFSTEPPTVPGSVNADIVKIVEKCSNILQFNSESAYVEDALLILGKSFYYQKNYQKSQRKFSELLASYPETDHAIEADLWIGKCQMRLKNYPEGLATLNDVRTRAVEEDEEEIIKEAYVEEIVYRVITEDYPGAIDLANEFMAVSDDDDIKAEVWYEIGNLNMKIGDVENAILAYENVFEFSPGFQLDVNAKLKYGRALIEGGQSDVALELFEDMRSEDKYIDNYAEIDFEIGKSLATLGRFEEALNQFSIVDTTYKTTTSSGAAKFEMGLVYERSLVNFDSATVYYRKASTSSLPKEYLEIAKTKSSLFTRYTEYRSHLNNYHEQLYYTLHPQEFVNDSIKYVEDSLAIAAEIANIQDLQAIWADLDSLLSFTDTTGFYQDTIKIVDSLLAHDSTLTLTRDSVFAKLRDPERIDTAMVTLFDSLFTYRDLDPKSQILLQERKQQEQSRQNELASILPDTLKFKNKPPVRPKLPRDSLHTLITKNELELGNLFLTELEMPDSSYWYYNNVLTEYPNTYYQATALYALGSYYLTVDEKRRADSLFNLIYDNYKNESIVNAAADKLNKPFIDLDFDPAKDSYKKAEDLMLAHDYAGAINGFYSVFKMYPNSSLAPKALYTCGWIMENDLFLLDSAAVYYDSLVANYPTTEFVRIVAPKLSMYKQEKRKIELAAQDSLYNLHLSGLDSLSTDSLQYSFEAIDSSSDSVQVAVGEENISNQNQTTEKKKEVPVTKEPVWNPRKRR